VAVALMAATMLWAAARAQATPPTPVLSGTDPESPGLSLTPVVHGSSSGIIISAFPGLRASAIASAGELGTTVFLYPNKDCEGEPFGEGSDAQLDTTGIQVTVEPETTTYISADQEDGEGLSGCSNAIAYEHVKELPEAEEPPPTEGEGGGGSGGSGGTTAPPDRPRLRTLPSGWGNTITPRVTGSAPGATTVRVYDVANCTGQPVAKVSIVAFAAGVRIRVVANAITAFSAVSVGAGGASRCSAPVYYGEDSRRPHTRITMGPASKTRRRVAVFRFIDTTGSGPGTKFLCRFNKKGKWRKWRRCKSPVKIRRLRPRRHRYLFRVRAVDPAGNRDRKPAKRRFKVVRRRG